MEVFNTSNLKIVLNTTNFTIEQRNGAITVHAVNVVGGGVSVSGVCQVQVSTSTTCKE